MRAVRRILFAPLVKEGAAWKARDLYWKPFSWLGTIRPTHPRTKPSTQRFWATFVSTTLGLEVSVIAHLLSVETGEGGQHAIIVVNSGQFCFFR
jgi:hypothetical protein